MHVQQDLQQSSRNKLADATPEGGEADTDNSLEDIARDEREYARTRLREELKHEPTEDEINEWLRQQTEGY